MHITSDRLTESLTHVELLHIESCTQCKIERQKLMLLKQSANQMDLIQPPVLAWQNIKRNQPENKKKISRFRQLVFASAASIFMLAVGWLMWSNYFLQQQLEEVLLVNMMLEDKLNFEHQVTFQEATLVESLQQLDIALYQAKTTKAKLSLLQERRELIQQHLALPKKDDHEFSI